jgi:uncharacterized flavoprotein (TIGR03862 family)
MALKKRKGYKFSMSHFHSPSLHTAVIGGGPAGLMAAEIIASAGQAVTVYDRMPSVGRKFLMAGRGGLNLTHSEGMGEALDSFMTRYGGAADWLRPMIAHFPPDALRQWCEGLGQKVFIGSSGRVFPVGMKASPLLRAWLRRLDDLGVRFALRRQWLGWDGDDLLFQGPGGEERVRAQATVLALGGASWPRLGSDGSWVEIMRRHDIPVAPLQPTNCGFIAPWSDFFAQRFAGQPLKSIGLTFDGRSLQGEAMVTAQGLEGGAIYALSGALRDMIAAEGQAVLNLDLRPGISREVLSHRLSAPRGRQSLSNFLRKAGGLSPVAIGLLREATSSLPEKPAALADLIKDLPVRLTAPCPIARAISTAGGVKLEALTEHTMLRARPGIFLAGEMLDWEAPTGGYLLQATFSTAVTAAAGVLDYLRRL